MVSTPSIHPNSHAEAVEIVLRVIDLIGARSDITDGELVEALMQSGVGKVDAELVIHFVPCAMSFALLKLMGVAKFPRAYRVYNSARELVEFPLEAEHFFTAALCLGYDITTQGYTERISKATFQAVTLRSAEMDAVNQFFKAGHTREEFVGSSVGVPIFYGITAEQIVASRKLGEV